MPEPTHPDAPEGEPAAPTPPRETRQQKARRLLSYIGWTMAATALPLGLDRLLIHPVLSASLGEDRFGALVWMIGLINMVGLIGYNGFAILLMRRFAHCNEADGRRMFRTAFLLTGALTAVVLGATVAVALPFAPAEVWAEVWPLAVGFACFGVVRGVGLILTTHLRIRRRFQWVFAFRAAEAAVLLLNLAFASRGSMWLIVLIYIASVLIPLPVGAVAARDVVGKGGWWSSTQARWLLAGWVTGASISLIDQAQVYGARVMLGVLDDDIAAVGALYAATAIGALFVVPVQMLSQLVLSLLGGKTDFALAGRRGLGYLGLALLFSVVVAGMSYGVGRLLVGWLYPDQSAVALGLYHWVALANGFEAIKQMTRPVMLKYAVLGRTVALSAVTLAVQLSAILVLVPRFGADGAAGAMAVSGSVAAVAWLTYFLLVHRRLSSAA